MNQTQARKTLGFIAESINQESIQFVGGGAFHGRGGKGKKAQVVAVYRLRKSHKDDDGDLKDIEKMVIKVMSDATFVYDYDNANKELQHDDFLGKNHLVALQNSMKNGITLPKDLDGLYWYDKQFFNSNLEQKQ